MDKLIIKKDAYQPEVSMKPLKVNIELHEAVKDIANKTNQPISKVSCMMIEFALAHVKIEE